MAAPSRVKDGGHSSKKAVVTAKAEPCPSTSGLNFARPQKSSKPMSKGEAKLRAQINQLLDESEDDEDFRQEVASMTMAELLELKEERKAIKEAFFENSMFAKIIEDMREAQLGPIWKKEITQMLFSALEEEPPPSMPIAKVEDVTAWSYLMVEVGKALVKRDSNFFKELSNSLEALNKAFPVHSHEKPETDDRRREVDARFIGDYWSKHKQAPEQRQVRENRELHWEYLGGTKPKSNDIKVKTKPLPQEGSYEFIARSPGRAKKARQLSQNKKC